MKYSQEKVDYILQGYAAGKNQKELANELNTYNTTIRRILLANGITPISHRERHEVVKTNIFSDLSCKETNYWLGLIATDGCLTKLNTIVIDLQLQDRELLEKYIEFTKSKVNLLTTTHYTGVKSHRVAFSSLQNFQQLEEYGITRKKSMDLRLTIPITFDLLRGIIDGDGSFSSLNKGARMQVSTASIDFANQIKDFLEYNGYHPTLTASKKKRINTMYTVNLYRKEELFRLYFDLYKDAYPFMKRKKDKIGSLLQKWSEYNWAKTGELCVNNPVLANGLELQFDDSHWASVETLHPTPVPCRDGEEKVQVE